MKFKDHIAEERFDLMCNRAKELALEMDEWSQANYNIELILTATVSTRKEDEALGRISDTHRTGRAFDIRTRDLPASFIAEFCAYFRKKYNKELGASFKQAPSLIVYKPHGSGPHIHVQLKRSYALNPGDMNVKE